MDQGKEDVLDNSSWQRGRNLFSVLSTVKTNLTHYPVHTLLKNSKNSFLSVQNKEFSYANKKTSMVGYGKNDTSHRRVVLSIGKQVKKKAALGGYNADNCGGKKGTFVMQK